MVVPGDIPLAIPLASIEANSGLLDDQVTSPEMVFVLPSMNEPVAVNCMDFSTSTVGSEGLMLIEVRGLENPSIS